MFRRQKKPLISSGAFLLTPRSSRLGILLLLSVLLGIALSPSLFLSLIPQPLGLYPGQRFFGCYLFLLVTCGCLAAISFLRGLKVDLRPLLLSLPFLLLIALGDLLWPQKYRVEPLLFVLFFGGAALLGGFLARGGWGVDFVKGLQSSIVVLSFFYGLIAILNYVYGIADQRYSVDEYVVWGFLNIRYWSHLASWFLPIVALTSIANPFPRFRLMKVFSFVAGAVWWWILFSTAARGATLGLFLAALLMLVIFRRDALPLLKAMTAHIASGICLWIVLTVILPLVLGGGVELRHVDADSSGRTPLWIEAWAMSLVNFPLGMGPQSWLTHDVLTTEYKSAIPLAHPHNMYLFWVAEYGWLSVLALALMVGGGFKRLIRSAGDRSEECKYYSRVVAVTASLAAAFIHAGVSAVFMAPASMLAGFFVISGGWALGFGKESSPSMGWPLRNSMLLRSLSGLVLGVLLVVGVQWLGEVQRYYHDNMVDRETYRGIGAPYAPRFWSHGDFPRQ